MLLKSIFYKTFGEYSQFSLFTVVMFYIITSTTEILHTEQFAPRGNTGSGPREPLVTTFVISQ